MMPDPAIWFSGNANFLEDFFKTSHILFPEISFDPFLVSLLGLF